MTHQTIEEIADEAKNWATEYTPLPDTGERKESETGAKRDAAIGKGYPHCIPPEALFRLAKHYERGAKKVSLHNWLLGMNLSWFIDSAQRHLWALQTGDNSEDHAAAILWNICGFMETDRRIRAGVLPQGLDDLPYRNYKADQ